MAQYDTIAEIHSMRDTISHLLEDMVYKASLCPQDERVQKEVIAALQFIGYDVHNGLRKLNNITTPAKNTRA